MGIATFLDTGRTHFRFFGNANNGDVIGTMHVRYYMTFAGMTS